jgi:hypothetical protein
MGSDEMILSSDEQKALTGMGDNLSEQEPWLASKFAIFTRLTSAEGEPPDEDLIRVIRPPIQSSPAKRVRRQRAAPRRRRPIVLVPAALLLLILIITISLAKGTGCATRTTREPAVAGHAVVSTCRQAGTTKTSGSSR